MRGGNEKHQTRFYMSFAVAISAAMGVAYAANLFTLFIFYEVLTLSTFPLVTHKGDDNARKGGRIYLGVLMATSIGLLAAGDCVDLRDYRDDGVCAGRHFGGPYGCCRSHRRRPAWGFTPSVSARRR